MGALHAHGQNVNISQNERIETDINTFKLTIDNTYQVTKKQQNMNSLSLNTQSTSPETVRKSLQSVESIQFQVHWPHGDINHYLENIIQKYLRKQQGIIATFFPGIGKDQFKVDYDPTLISQKEIVTILECFQLEVVPL